MSQKRCPDFYNFQDFFFQTISHYPRPSKNTQVFPKNLAFSCQSQAKFDAASNNSQKNTKISYHQNAKGLNFIDFSSVKFLISTNNSKLFLISPPKKTLTFPEVKFNPQEKSQISCKILSRLPQNSKFIASIFLAADEMQV